MPASRSFLFITLLSLVLSGLAVPAVATGDGFAPLGLRVEYAVNPLGIDATTPRLSWRSTSGERDARQSAYQIQVAASPGDLESGQLLWDSGRVSSDASLFIPYGGPELVTAQRVYWRVKLWDGDSHESAWSEHAHWEMGLLQEGDWQAQWISHAGPVDTEGHRPAAMLRKAFTVDGDVASARLYATARGIYAAELNGAVVGDQVLAPGWTSYDHRIQYQTFDVTAQLQRGDNALGAQLADGWYRGYLGWDGKRNIYGDRTAFKAQLVITYADGRMQVVATDDSWRVSRDGPYRAADLYDGEVYDARREIPGWSTAGFDDGDWTAAVVETARPEALVAPEGPPIRVMDEIRPVKISRAPNGEVLVDMGQNMVGWVRLRVKGEAGAKIVLRHAEVLDPDGNIYTENLRAADATDEYILAGRDEEVYEPRFSFHGFRYVGIRGYPGDLKPEHITGVVVYSAMPQAGHWESSEPLLNQLYSNIVWGQRGNFLDVPTDCPQRDERLGWTGDAQVFAPTAALNMDVSGFFAKWLRDLALDQKPSGSVPFVVPDIFANAEPQAMPQHGTAGWSDAATVIPWVMYQAYGDTGFLQRQFNSMKAWVNYVTSQAGDDHIWRPVWQFGDWLAPELKPQLQGPGYQARTEVDLIATAYYAHSADLLARTAAVLGKDSEATAYRHLFEEIRTAFQREFVTPAGRVYYDTQTAYVLALSFDLLPEEMRAQAAANLAADVKKRGNHLTTGFLGTPDLTHVLSRYGQTETAYDLLLQTTYPSWLFPVTFGATTIWERWDSLREDGTFQNPEMTSFNHYAYGAVGHWMVTTVAGLGAAAPGYKQLLVAPKPGGGLQHASASHDTPYGRAYSGWSTNGSAFALKVEIPVNTQAEVILPLAASAAVKEGGVALDKAEGVRDTQPEGDDLRVVVGSGVYQFEYQSEALALQAAGYRKLDETTPLRELVKLERVKAIIEQGLPEQAATMLLAAGAGSTLAELRNTEVYADVAVEILEALPAIDAARRVAILAPH